uniref:Uncharacterized protein n=1 Tax=Anguilla anguilla TaxID=7936 RepID=A0A0E9S5V2_ANGAN
MKTTLNRHVFKACSIADNLELCHYR